MTGLYNVKMNFRRSLHMLTSVFSLSLSVFFGYFVTSHSHSLLFICYLSVNDTENRTEIVSRYLPHLLGCLSLF